MHRYTWVIKRAQQGHGLIQHIERKEENNGQGEKLEGKNVHLVSNCEVLSLH